MNNVEEFNDNLFFVFEKLLMDKELAEKFAECKTEDELYNFCLKIKGGYTKEEWEKFAEIIYKLTINKENDKILLDNDLEEIGGGSMTNNIGKKALSGTLAALTAATVLQVGSVGASAASSSPKPKTSVSQRSSSPRWKKIIRGVLIGAGVAAVAVALGYGVHRFIEHKKEKNNTPKIFNEQPNSSNSSIKNNKQPGDLANRPIEYRSLSPEELKRVHEQFGVNTNNPGNTCYCITLIRGLFAMESLRDGVKNYNGKSEEIKDLKEIFESLEKGYVDGKRLEEVCKKCFGYNGRPDDIHEAYEVFTDKVEKSDKVFFDRFVPTSYTVPSSTGMWGNDGNTRSVQYLVEHGAEPVYKELYKRLKGKSGIDQDRLEVINSSEYSDNRKLSLLFSEGLATSDDIGFLDIVPKSNGFILHFDRGDTLGHFDMNRFSAPQEVTIKGVRYKLTCFSLQKLLNQEDISKYTDEAKRYTNGIAHYNAICYNGNQGIQYESLLKGDSGIRGLTPEGTEQLVRLGNFLFYVSEDSQPPQV